MDTKKFLDKYSPFFTINEKWGDISKIQENHLDDLFAIRKEIAIPIIIHCSHATSGHSENSYHYKGLATDFHFATDIHIMRQYFELESVLHKLNLYTKIGVGVYPEWNSPGFHIDSRGVLARWIYEGGKIRGI